MKIDIKEDKQFPMYTIDKCNINITLIYYILILFLFLLSTLDILLILINHAESTSFIDVIKLFWLTSFVLGLFSFIGVLLIVNGDNFSLQRRPQQDNYKVIFQITSRGFNVEAIIRSVGSVRYRAPKYLRDYEIWLVTEPDAKIDNVNDVRIIKVPSTFSTRNNTKFKARAMEYARLLRRDYVGKDVWIYYLDEESVIGEDTILGIIDFIENKRGDIGQGLIVYTNFFGKNLFTYLADSIRSSADVSMLFFQIVTGFVPWMHGSHVLIRADVEASIGWDFGVTWSEDSLFGLEAQRMGYRIMWLKGRLYEQSPFTVNDFLKQRRRWVFHSIDVMRRRLPIKVKVYYAYSLVVWASGLFSMLAAILSVFSNAVFPFNNAFILLTIIIATSWLSSYFIGLYLNTQPLGLPFSRLIFFFIIAVIIGSLLEGLAVWYAILSANKMNKIGFEVIKK